MLHPRLPSVHPARGPERRQWAGLLAPGSPLPAAFPRLDKLGPVAIGGSLPGHSCGGSAGINPLPSSGAEQPAPTHDCGADRLAP